MSESGEANRIGRGVIWRYDIADGAVLRIPAGARLLHVGWESAAIRLWVMVDPQLPKLERRVKAVPTGGELDPEGWEFVGTVITPQALVWHVFLQII